MALAQLRRSDITRLLRAVPMLVDLPASRLWIDYDEDSDVLYLSFQRPQRADDSELREDGIIIHRRGKPVVGVTILDASTR